MEKVQIKVTGSGLDLSYTVSSQVAGMIVRQLNEAAFAPTASASPLLPPGLELADISPSYRPLAEYLSDPAAPSIFSLTFREIEQILGGPLPASARKHKAWWANTGSHSQASAWMKTGFQTADVQLEHEMITFLRKN